MAALFNAHWTWLHRLSFQAELAKPPVNNFDQLVLSSFNLLTCSDCRQDAKEVYTKIQTQQLMPVDRILELHNQINRKLGKTTWTRGQLNSRYQPHTFKDFAKAYFEWLIPLYRELNSAQISVYQGLITGIHQNFFQSYLALTINLETDRSPNQNQQLKLYKYYQHLCLKLGLTPSNFSQLAISRTVRSASGGCSSCQKKRQRYLESQKTTPNVVQSAPKVAPPVSQVFQSIPKVVQPVHKVVRPTPKVATAPKVVQPASKVAIASKVAPVSQFTLPKIIQHDYSRDSYKPVNHPVQVLSDHKKLDQTPFEPSISPYPLVPLSQRKALHQPGVKSLRKTTMIQHLINQPIKDSLKPTVKKVPQRPRESFFEKTSDTAVPAYHTTLAANAMAKRFIQQMA